MSFTAEQLRLLATSDQVEDLLTSAERNRLHSAESVRRRIERIGLAEFRRIKAAAVVRYLARKKAAEALDRTRTSFLPPPGQEPRR